MTFSRDLGKVHGYICGLETVLTAIPNKCTQPPLSLIPASRSLIFSSALSSSSGRLLPFYVGAFKTPDCELQLMAISSIPCAQLFITYAGNGQETGEAIRASIGFNRKQVRLSA